MIVKKIDVHIHTAMWKGVQRITGGTFASPDEIREKYDAWGIEKGFILPFVNPEGANIVQSNEEVYQIVQDHGDIFGWFCNLNPHMGNNTSTTNFSHFLNHYKNLGAKGVGELTFNMYADDPMVENLLYHCAECDLPVLFHIGPTIGNCYGLVDEVGLPRIEKLLKKYPKLIMIGHSQPWWAEISTDVTQENRNTYPKGKVTAGRLCDLLGEYGNLYADMSAGSGFNAISRDVEFAYKFIERFQDKLMFGTDICSPKDYMPLSKWLDDELTAGNISQTVYEKISRGNAIKLLKL